MVRIAIFIFPKISSVRLFDRISVVGVVVQLGAKSYKRLTQWRQENPEKTQWVNLLLCYERRFIGCAFVQSSDEQAK